MEGNELSKQLDNDLVTESFDDRAAVNYKRVANATQLLREGLGVDNTGVDERKRSLSAPRQTRAGYAARQYDEAQLFMQEVCELRFEDSLGFNHLPVQHLELLFSSFTIDAFDIEGKDLPRSITEALSDPDEGGGWKGAKAYEDNKLAERNVLGKKMKVKRLLQQGKQVVNSAYVWKRKFRNCLDGVRRLSKYRARLVAKEFKRERGKKTYAPTVRSMSVKILLAYGFQKHFFRKIADVDSAFLYGKARYEMWLRRPPEDREYDDDGDELAEEILGNLYGGTTAPREWHVVFVAASEKLKLTRFETDRCVFRLVVGSTVLFLWLHVDDIGFTSGSVELIDAVATQLKTFFDMTGPDPMLEYTGMNIKEHNNHLYFDGRPYLKAKLQQLGYANEDGSFKTELATKTVLKKEKRNPLSPPSSDVKHSQGMIGSLIWAYCTFRCDIGRALLEVTKDMDKPTQQTDEWCHWIWRFILGTLDELLFVKRDPKYLAGDSMRVEKLYFDWSHGYVDSTWEVPVSVTGLLLVAFGLLVVGKTVKQTTSALSSTEAEISGELEGCKHGLFGRRFVGEMLGVDAASLPATVFLGDNLGALKFAREGAISSKLKHIELATLRMSEWSDAGHFDWAEISSWLNHADFWTKLMGGPDTARHRAPFFRRVNFV